MNVLLVAIGGAIGAVLRFALGTWAPWSTVAINVAGCFAIGVVSGRLTDPAMRAFVMTGVLGGFTTFSAFGLEAVTMPAERAMPYVAASVGLGIAAAWVGMRV